MQKLSIDRNLQTAKGWICLNAWQHFSIWPCCCFHNATGFKSSHWIIIIIIWSAESVHFHKRLYQWLISLKKISFKNSGTDIGCCTKDRCLEDLNEPWKSGKNKIAIFCEAGRRHLLTMQSSYRVWFLFSQVKELKNYTK